MFTLSIEHAISDFRTWKAAFDSFADTRAQAGVLSDRIRCPVDDRQYLVIELEFATKERAESFRQFLTSVIWRNPETSPALAGSPTARVLEPVPD